MQTSTAKQCNCKNRR